MTHPLRNAVVITSALGVAGLLVAACVEAPPAIPALASKPLSLRLHVFGADATDAHDAVVAIHKNNPSFSVVPQGGDADLLIGLEKDSAQCVEPTALCSYRISYRVRNPEGKVLLEGNETILADSDSCSRLCDKALNKVAAKVVEDAANAVHEGKANAPEPSTSTADVAPGAAPSASGAKASPSATVKPVGSAAAKGPTAAGASAKPPADAAPPADAEEPAPGDKGMCSVAVGPALPAKEAETRVAQVDALKRLGVIDEAEFDCLRKAYLDRL